MIQTPMTAYVVCGETVETVWLDELDLSAGWKVVPPPHRDTVFLTEWGEKVTPENAWREYPRPQMVRADGLTVFAGTCYNYAKLVKSGGTGYLSLSLIRKGRT